MTRGTYIGPNNLRDVLLAKMVDKNLSETLLTPLDSRYESKPEWNWPRLAKFRRSVFDTSIQLGVFEKVKTFGTII
jgi:hypothetical protein